MPRGMHPNSQKNLIQNRPKDKQLTPNERRENATKAGIISGEARREKKTLREELEVALNTEVIEKNTGKVINRQYAITIALINKAAKGDPRAFEVIRDTIGEKPTDRIAIGNVDPETVKAVEKMVMGNDP